MNDKPVTISRDLFDNLVDYLGEFADCDYEGEKFIPNEAMVLQTELYRADDTVAPVLNKSIEAVKRGRS